MRHNKSKVLHFVKKVCIFQKNRSKFDEAESATVTASTKPGMTSAANGARLELGTWKRKGDVDTEFGAGDATSKADMKPAPGDVTNEACSKLKMGNVPGDANTKSEAGGETSNAGTTPEVGGVRRHAEERGT